MLLAAVSGKAHAPAHAGAQQETAPSFSKTGAELAVDVAVNLTIPSHEASGIIYTARYDDGSDDHAAAIVAALKVATRLGNATVLIGGAVNVSSDHLPFIVPSNTKVTGMGESATIITVTGTRVVSSVFKCMNAQGIFFSDFTLVGNSRANAYANGAAISWTANLGTTLRRLKITDCTFENFGGDYWIYVQNLGTAPMQEVNVTGCTFISRAGNARQPKGIGADSSCIGVIGSPTSRSGTVERVSISNNTAKCDYIKSFFVAYRSTRFIKVSANEVLNCGAQGIADNCGAYAIMLYDSSGFQPPDSWTLSGNLLVAPRACGIYLAACTRGTVSGNTITGQYDQHDGSIPKGGIAVNAANHLNINGNTLLDCFRGVAIVGRAFEIAVNGNTIESTVKDAIGVKLSGGKLTDIDVAGNSLSMSGSGSRGIFLQSFADEAGLEQILIAGNRLTATYCCIEHYSPDSSYNATHVYILNNKLRSDAQHMRLANTPNPLSIGNNVLTGAAGTRGCDVSGSTQVSILSNSFEDFTSGYALRTNDTRGTFWGNSFARSSALLDPSGAGEILGATVPTWRGTVGMKVQNGNMMEPDSTGTGFITGWVYNGTKWVPMSVAAHE